MFKKCANQPFIFPIITQMKNATMSAATMVEPTGVDANIEISIPITAQTTDKDAENITTPLKFFISLIAESAGKIISADIRSEPTRFIPSTIITAIIIAIRRLYLSVFTPVAFEKFSSKVTAKSLL